MDEMNNEKQKKAALNIDTTITEVKFKERHNGRAYRKIDSIGNDEGDGIVNKVTTEILLDACDEPITSKFEVAGKCKVCERIIKKNNAVRCDGRCGELMDIRCFRKQGSHALHGRKFCRWDYWLTKFFWMWISPSLRRPKNEGINEGKRYFTNPEARAGREPFRGSRGMRASQQEN